MSLYICFRVMNKGGSCRLALTSTLAVCCLVVYINRYCLHHLLLGEDCFIKIGSWNLGTLLSWSLYFQDVERKVRFLRKLSIRLRSKPAVVHCQVGGSGRGSMRGHPLSNVSAALFRCQGWFHPPLMDGCLWGRLRYARPCHQLCLPGSRSETFSNRGPPHSSERLCLHLNLYTGLGGNCDEDGSFEWSLLLAHLAQLTVAKFLSHVAVRRLQAVCRGLQNIYQAFLRVDNAELDELDVTYLLRHVNL